MDRFLLMHCFARAVETGSFSAVARELGTGQPNISRHIASLEQHRGTRLLHRSTRKLTLTPEGERYDHAARRVLDAIAEAESNARGENAPQRPFAVACPTAARAFAFIAQREAPARPVPVKWNSNCRSAIALSIWSKKASISRSVSARSKDSALKAPRRHRTERVCVASNEYLAQHPEPTLPDDLRNHNCIVYTLASAGNTWSFRGRDVTVDGRFPREYAGRRPQRSARRSWHCVLAGLAILEDAIRDARVKSLLTEHRGPLAPIHIVYAANRLLPSRARVFMDFIASAFARDPAEPFPNTYQVPASAPLLIQGAVVLTGSGKRLDGVDILIENGRIKAVGAALSAPAGAHVIAAQGRWVTPGMSTSTPRGLSQSRHEGT